MGRNPNDVIFNEYWYFFCSLHSSWRSKGNCDLSNKTLGLERKMGDKMPHEKGKGGGGMR